MKKQYLEKTLKGVLEGTARESDTGILLGPYDEKKFSVLRNCYKGIGGVLYTLALFFQKGISRERYKKEAFELLEWLLNHHSTEDDQMPGLFSGEAGIAKAIVELYHSGILKSEDWFPDYFYSVSNVEPSNLDITNGSAGQGLAILGIAEKISKDYLPFASKHANFLLSCQSPEGFWSSVEENKKNEGISLGFSHGVAGMAYFLAVYGRKANDKEAYHAALKASEWLWKNRIKIDTQSEHRVNWPYSTERPQEVTNQWCHGAAGISLLFMELFRQTSDTKYLIRAELALNYAVKPSELDELGLCHGLAGHGEIFLEMYRLTGRKKYLNKVLVIWNWINKLSCEKNGMLLWLSTNHNENIPVASLMVGNSGIGHFGLRLLMDSNGDMRFPLLD